MDVDALKCPDCGSKRLFIDPKRAELVCARCNLVVAEAVPIQGSEIEIENDVRVRSGDDRLLPQYRFGSRDAAGKTVNYNLLWKYRRAARTHNLRPSERTVLSMESRIRDIGALRGIPRGLVERAVNLYHQCKAKNTFSKPSLDEWAASLVLSACRETGHIVTVGNMAEDLDARRVLEYHHKIVRELGLRAKALDIPDYVVYFARWLSLAPDSPTIKHAIRLVELSPNQNASPHCVAAAALYIAMKMSGINVTQRLICRVANMSEISLRHWATRLGGYYVRDARMPSITGVVASLDDECDKKRSESEKDAEA
mgnify:CR=1 FL=1